MLSAFAFQWTFDFLDQLINKYYYSASFDETKVPGIISLRTVSADFGLEVKIYMTSDACFVRIRGSII